MTHKRRSLRVIGIFVLTLAALMLAAPPGLADQTYEYDALGRVIKVTDTATGKTITYNYDAAGNRTTVVAAQPNTAPVAVNDSATADLLFNTTIYPLNNDTDADSDPLTITTWSEPSGTSVSYNSTTKAMTLGGFETGNYTVTYDISDGNGGTDQGSIALTITEPFGYCETPPGSGFWIPC